MHAWGLQEAPVLKTRKPNSLSPGTLIAAASPAAASGKGGSGSDARGSALTNKDPQSTTLHAPPGLNRGQQQRRGNVFARLSGAGQVVHQPPFPDDPLPSPHRHHLYPLLFCCCTSIVAVDRSQTGSMPD